MLKLLTTDWASYLFDLISLKIYEREQHSRKKNKQLEKKKILKNNRIIVKVNNSVIYDSKKEKEMSDDLFYALLSYGLMDSVNSGNRNKKSPINYNITPSISTMPVLVDSLVTKNAI